MSNGHYAMTIVSQIIRKMPPDTSCHQFCVSATKAIRDVYLPPWYLFPLLSRRGAQRAGRSDQPIDYLTTLPEERLCASAIVYSNRRREIWLVGDCQCLVGGELCENPKPYEQRLAEMRAQKVKELLAQGKTPDEILADDQARAAIIPETRVPVIVLDFRPWEIVLASDGYPFLCPTLAESEARLDEQRRNDPLNIGRFKATKGFTPGFNSFDDRSYIRFTV